MAEQRIEVTFGAQIKDLLSGLRTAHSATKETVDGMKGQLSGLAGVVDAVKAPFIAITAVLAGGAIFGEAIRDTADLGEHLEILSQKTGVQADELSRLEYAAKLADTGIENLDAGLVKMARFMGEAAKGTGDAADTAARLGISVKDAEGKLRPMRDVLLDVADKVSHMKDGAGKSALAMELFGKAGTSMIPMLNQGRAGIEALEKEADRLGITMSNEGAQAAADYGDAMDRLHGVIQGFARYLVLAVMPALTDTANAITSMRDASSGAEKGMNPLATGIRFVAAAGLEGYAAINALAQGVKFLKVLLTTPVDRNFLSTVKAAWFEMGDEVTRVNDKVANALLKLRGFGGVRAGLGIAGAKRGDGAEAPDDPGKTKKTSPGSDERLAAWKDELNQIKQTEDLGKDTLLVDEISFWQAKLRTIQGNGKADVKLRQQINAELLAADKQLHADEQRSAAIRAQIDRDAELEKIEVERRSIEERRAFRQIDAKEAEAELIALNERMLAIKLAALEAERAVAQGDLVKQAEIDAQIAAAKRAAGRELAEINQQTTQEIVGQWDQVLDRVGQGFERMINGLLTGTLNVRQGLKSIFQQMTIDFLSSKLKELQHHVAIELAKRGITTATASHKVITEGAAAVKSLAITAAHAIKEIAIHAARAAAGAFAAIAAIPFVGPILAPIAAGVALAAVLALGSRVASAEGGYDIPSHVNPLTQLHHDEMVLPAPLANAVRGMASGRASAPALGAPAGSGASAGAATASSIAVTIAAAVEKATTAAAAAQPAREVHEHTYHVHAMDARSLEDFLRRNPAAVAAGMKAAARNGHITRPG